MRSDEFTQSLSFGLWDVIEPIDYFNDVLLSLTERLTLRNLFSRSRSNVWVARDCELTPRSAV